MLHPFTTMSLIIVSFQIHSKNWHAAEVSSVVTWITSFFLLFPFRFSIHGLESNTMLSKGSRNTMMPAEEKMKPVIRVSQGPSWLSTLPTCPKG